MCFKQNKSISPVGAAKPNERQRKEKPAVKIRECGGEGEKGSKGVSLRDKWGRKTWREKGGRGGVSWRVSFGSELLGVFDSQRHEHRVVFIKLCASDYKMCTWIQRMWLHFYTVYITVCECVCVCPRCCQKQKGCFYTCAAGSCF